MNKLVLLSGLMKDKFEELIITAAREGGKPYMDTRVELLPKPYSVEKSSFVSASFLKSDSWKEGINSMQACMMFFRFEATSGLLDLSICSVAGSNAASNHSLLSWYAFQVKVRLKPVAHLLTCCRFVIGTAGHANLRGRLSPPPLPGVPEACLGR